MIAFLVSRYGETASERRASPPTSRGIEAVSTSVALAARE
jgi:hypothetical protein